MKPKQSRDAVMKKPSTMTTTEPLLADLIERLGEHGAWVAGERLAEEFGVTRAAIWKRITRLRELGVDVEAKTGLGYRLATPVELLDGSRIGGRLSQAATERLAAVELIWQAGSTNTYLLEQDPAPGGLIRVCLAEHQSAGRGRRGRSWVSPLGANIYLSLGWGYEVIPAGLSALGPVLAVQAVRALESLGVQGVGVKWPNDLIWQNRKLGGLLLESRMEAAAGCRVVAGLGLNVRMPSQAGGGIDQSWTDLTAICNGFPPCRNDLAVRLIETAIEGVDRFAATGFAAFSRDWQRLDRLNGLPVQVKQGGRTLLGQAGGVDNEGALILQTDQRRMRVFSGDASVRAC